MVPLQEMIAQEIGLQMGSMRELFKEGMPATLARIKELGVTELEGGGGRGVAVTARIRIIAREDGVAFHAIFI